MTPKTIKVLGRTLREVHDDPRVAGEWQTLSGDVRATDYGGHWVVRVGRESTWQSFDVFGTGRALAAAERDCMRKLRALQKRIADAVERAEQGHE